MIDKGISYEDQRLTEKQKKKIKPANQGGGPNYLGKQETVTVPKKWLSDPDHVVAELAYITPREKKILLDANLYGSLKGKPNRGPAGIQSLQGDMGGFGGTGGPSGGPSGGGNNDGPSARERNMGLQGKTGKTDKSIGGGGVDDRGTKQQNANQRAQVRAGNVRAVEELIDRPTFGFTDAAKYNLLSPKSIGSGIISLATGVPVLGSILTNMGPFNNQDFYNQKVVPAGKTDLNYDDYMSARMAGEIDAYGNPIGNTGGGRDDLSQAQLLQQAAIANPIANPTVETPQGGVGALYAQYMRNLGYTL
jgi:hypothetical protein